MCFSLFPDLPGCTRLTLWHGNFPNKYLLIKLAPSPLPSTLIVFHITPAPSLQKHVSMCRQHRETSEGNIVK